MEKIRYVYVIRYRVSYEAGSQSDFCGTYRVYSSLRKAIDLLELYKEIYTTKFVMAGYDIVIDNISFAYTGLFGIRADSLAKNITITNCKFSWIGGSLFNNKSNVDNSHK